MRRRGLGCFDPTDGTLLFLSEVRVRVSRGSLLRQGDVGRLRWDPELSIGPFRLEVLWNRNEGRQRGQFRLPISGKEEKQRRLVVSDPRGPRNHFCHTHEGPAPAATNEKT
jgi:hypothetical protein